MKLDWALVDSRAAAASRDTRVLQWDLEGKGALFGGSRGETYQVSLDACSCMAFKRKPMQPCKHMVRLASELGLLESLRAQASEKSRRPVCRFLTLSDYVTIDIETTGLSAAADGIVELAAVRVQDGQVTDTFSALCNPGIPNAAEFKNHITADMLSEAPTAEDALRDFLAFVGDRPVVGHNVAAFDSVFIHNLSMRALGRPFDNELIDTLRWSEKSFGELAHHRLEDMCAYFGIAGDQAHRALSDALCTQKLYECLKHYVFDGEARPACCVFGGYEPDQIFKRIVEITGDTEGNVTCKTLKTGFSVAMFGAPALTIKLNTRSQTLETASDAALAFAARIPGAAETKTGSRFPLACDAETVPAYEALLRAVYEQKRAAVLSEQFGCCSDFVRCSDALECIHRDDAEYSGCYYRKNLEAGRVFYGKNRNQPEEETHEL